MADNETIAAIIAEMRKLGKLDEKSIDEVPRTLLGLGLRTYADRLEAAWKRELGNAAKLREALYKIRDYLLTHQYNVDEDELLGMATTAFAAPPRNCERFQTKDAEREAFQKLRHHRVWADVSLWDDRGEIEAFLDWLFAPATEKEGGAK